MSGYELTILVIVAFAAGLGIGHVMTMSRYFSWLIGTSRRFEALALEMAALVQRLDEERRAEREEW